MLVAAVGILVVLAAVRLVMVDGTEDVDGTVAEAPVAAVPQPVKAPVPAPRKTARKPARAEQVAQTGPLAIRVKKTATPPPARQPRPAPVKAGPPTPAPTAPDGGGQNQCRGSSAPGQALR